MTSDAPNNARAALDQAIRDYTKACDNTAEELGAFIPTGWVMIAAGVRSSFDGDDGTAYISESMPGQPWHAALGLWQYGHDKCRYNSVRSEPGDGE